jgi:hypothetical protein
MKIEEKSELVYPINAIFAALFVGVVYLFWSWVYPWNFTHFWFQVGTLKEWLFEVRWWFMVMASFTVVMFLLSRSRREKLISQNSIDYIKYGTVISLIAGILEEICFRWIFFYSAIVGVKIFNWILLGFIDINIIKWIYEVVLWPIANYCTLGYLESYLQGLHWSIAAGLLSANVKFRNGHAYQGFIGWTHSWFAGMILFYIMFKYGIVAAMTIHFLYDMMLFTLDAFLVSVYHTIYGKPQAKVFGFSAHIRKMLAENGLKGKKF